MFKLSNWDYERIKEEVSFFMEDYSPLLFPLDPKEVAKKMNIKVVTSKQFLTKKSRPVDQYFGFDYPNAFRSYDQKRDQIVIFIDDLNTNANRQRTSFFHELGHIRLGHSEQSAKNEAEADFFMSYALAPSCLIKIPGITYRLLDDEPFVMKTFHISREFASAAMSRFELRLDKGPPEVLPYEETIINAMSEFIKNKLIEK
jgi:Zn-dependent peptidase ImmA (M78 family)